MRRFPMLGTILVFVVLCTSALAQSSGRVAGRVTRTNGEPIGGVVVVINEAGAATTTDANGAFILSVPPGSYTVSFTAGEKVENESVTVTSGTTTQLDKSVDWQLSFAEAITVYSASRQTERIVDAPAAVTVIQPEELELASASGQLPKVLESAPGVDFTQSGVYDFNFNTRGFNSSLNRRILTLIDGRDPSVPFLGAAEWGALSYPLDEMSSVELVRGPGSALYGANAFNGVLNMVTKQPRYAQGGKIQLSGGDLSTVRGDARYADELGGGWFYRVVGGYQKSDDFAVSRNATVEYTRICGAADTRECLRREARPLALFEDKIAFLGLRLDKHFVNTHTLTFEAGSASLEGPIFQTGIGRVQVTDVHRPWARVNYNTLHWNVLGYYDSRNADAQVALASGALLYEDSHNLHGEIQGNYSFLANRGRIVGGVAYNDQEIDTSNPSGFHTLMAEAKSENQQAVFGQVEYNITDSLKAVIAARWDDSTLHEAQTSPKAALVYGITPNHTVRLNYSEAFQVPNFSEFFLRVPAGAPITAFAPLENALRPALGGVSLGFQSIPILALGNGDLEVEQITTQEIGYSGIYGGRLYMTADYYQGDIDNFVTDLLPGVNPAFAPYAPPAGLPAPVVATILGTLRGGLGSRFVGLTNLPGGQPALVVSYTNAGKVETQGVELAMNYYLTNSWIVDANYSWFDFEVKEQQLGDVLVPNAPENKYNLGLSYRGPRFDASLKYRWVDEFFWAAGVFQGTVPQYDVVNVAASFRVFDQMAIGLNVSNAFDDVHYESFGGDLLERRALGYVAFNW